VKDSLKNHRAGPKSGHDSLSGELHVLETTLSGLDTNPDFDPLKEFQA
jgi:hypothetical protein